MATGNSPPPSSSAYFRKTVTLLDWWLTKPQTHHRTKTLGVAGFPSKQNQAVRCFSSAPIDKVFDIFELETVDGVCVILRGYINKDRTLQNGFPPEVFNHFIFGFPYNWKKFRPKIESATGSGADGSEDSQETATTSDDSLVDSQETATSSDVSSEDSQETATSSDVSPEDSQETTAGPAVTMEDSQPTVEIASVQEEDGKDSSQNCDSNIVDMGVEDCEGTVLSNKDGTSLVPSSDEIPHVDAGNKELREKSLRTPKFKDNPSLETSAIVSNTMVSSTPSVCLGDSSMRMTRSMKKMADSKISIPLSNDASNLDKETLTDPRILGTPEILNKDAVNVVDCDMKSKSRKSVSNFSGGCIKESDETTRSECLGVSSSRMTRSMKKMANSKISIPLSNDASDLDKETPTDPRILGTPEILNKDAVNVADCDMKSKSREIASKFSGGCIKESNETTRSECLGVSSSRMTRSMKKMANSKISIPLANDTSNLDKETLTDPRILGTPEIVNKNAVNVVDCDMKSKRRKIVSEVSDGCIKGSNETASCSKDIVIKVESKRKRIDQNVDVVITMDTRSEDDADTRIRDEEKHMTPKCSDPSSKTSVGVTDVNDDIVLVRTNMKGCGNRKKNRVDVPQKERAATHDIISKEAVVTPNRSAATHGIISEEAVVTPNTSQTKLLGKRKLITSPKSPKSPPSRGKKGSEGRYGSANILPIESVSGKKTRSGRVILPHLEYWRNQKVIYDEDGVMRGVQEPK